MEGYYKNERASPSTTAYPQTAKYDCIYFQGLQMHTTRQGGIEALRQPLGKEQFGRNYKRKLRIRQ